MIGFSKKLETSLDFSEYIKLKIYQNAETTTELVLALVMSRLDYCNAVLASRTLQQVSFISWTFATTSRQA